MYDDIRLRVARSYTSSPDYFMSSVTLSSHILLGLPLFRRAYTFMYIALIPTYAPLFSSHAHTTSTCFPALSFRFPSLYWSYLLFHSLFRPVSSATSTYLFSCDFFTVHISAPVHQCRSYHCPVHFPLVFTLIFLSHNTPATLFPFTHPLCTMRATSEPSQRRSHTCENLHCIYCLSM